MDFNDIDNSFSNKRHDIVAHFTARIRGAPDDALARDFARAMLFKVETLNAAQKRALRRCIALTRSVEKTLDNI